MTRLRALPNTALGRVRLTALLFGVALMLSAVAVVEHAPQGWLWAARLLPVLICAILVATAAAGRVLWPEPVVVPVLVGVLGLVCNDPLASVGPAVACVSALSVYGGRASVLTRTALMVPMPVLATAFGTQVGDRTWYSPEIFNVVPAVVIFTVLMRVLNGSLDRLERGRARAELIAACGRRLIGCTEAAEVLAVGQETARAIIDATPGLVLLPLAREEDRLVIQAAWGLDGDGERFRGRLLPLGVVARVDPDDTQRIVELEGDHRALDLMLGRSRGWHAMGAGDPLREMYLLISGNARTEVFDTIRTLTSQLALAFANCRTHAELSHQASTDQLTTMPNRAAFFRRLADAVDAAAGGPSGIVLLVVDLDDFKRVNDTYGHGAGDELLVEVAGRMTRTIGEHGTAARFGGDEFAVMLTGLTAAAAEDLAGKLLDRLLQPAGLGLGTVAVGASIGFAAHEPGSTAGDLIRCADIAMYSAKARGKNRVEVFSARVHGEIAHLRLLEEHLATAISTGEIDLHYQPIVDLADGRCVGAEALARWRHPTLGDIAPAAFIPLAERGGFARLLGDAVLRAACLQLAAWSRLPGGAELRMAVNVFGRQLGEAGFAEGVREHLRTAGLEPHRLTLELNEAALLEDEGARMQLEALAAHGVRIALDDFGAGYASLANLRNVPVHQLKIDHRLLRTGGRPGELVDLIMSVGRFLGLETVAEAVETEEHRDWAVRAGIGLAQGWLFAAPMPPEDFPAWFDRASVAHAVP